MIRAFVVAAVAVSALAMPAGPASADCSGDRAGCPSDLPPAQPPAGMTCTASPWAPHACDNPPRRPVVSPFHHHPIRHHGGHR